MEYDSPRALMSCGHAVTPMSLTDWCRRQLEQVPRQTSRQGSLSKHESVIFLCSLIRACGERWEAARERCVKYLCVSQGSFTFVCGKCDAEWSITEVKRMALLTPEEDDDFEQMIFENAANSFLEVKQVSPTV